MIESPGINDDPAAAENLIRAQGERAKVLRTSHSIQRFLLDADAQTREYIRHSQEQLKKIELLVNYVATLETNLADAKTVIRAMAEADTDQDSGGVQAIARTYLRRFEAEGQAERSDAAPTPLPDTK